MTFMFLQFGFKSEPTQVGEERGEERRGEENGTREKLIEFGSS